MAYLAQYHTYPMRSTHKEPQWTTVYDDLFSQYVDIDADDFKFGTSSSDEASNNEIVEGQFTDGGDSSSSEAAARRLSDDFWARTLAVLEESASSLEQQQDGKQQRESQQETHHHNLSPAASFYNTKNAAHADFLSLGGFPSPHISTVPSSPSVEAAARRRKATRYQQERSTRTLERPVGVTKTYRSPSKSPKMMSPSRYRTGGAQDAWVESIYQTPDKMTSINLPVRSMPLTPPSSGRSRPAVGLGFQGWSDLDASPIQPFSNCAEQDPLCSSSLNQQSLPRHMFSPEASPLTSPSVDRGAMFAGEPSIFRDIYYEQPLTTDCYNKSAWSANSFAAEDIYEPSPTFSPWMASEKKEAEYQASLNDFHVHNSLLPTNFHDPTLAPAYAEEPLAGLETVAQVTPYYTTNTYLATTRRESRTPSPPRNRIGKRSSSSKPHSRKSSSDHKAHKASKSGGFVNYTPSDSEKLLTGVAPSGSSKTKARGEREAAERWRRFSQAAAKAVAEAGGALPAMAPVANMLPAHTDLVDTQAGGSWSRA